ncbi:GNAT family N-acetyltransferase [Aneurinibacillus sp. REN35]|uniref:GNAT family N-acetyltransferase n=1 Tax=Aneurinibacillus sp. REN35 TaxID=3237286 RepID=UPI0035270990
MIDHLSFEVPEFLTPEQLRILCELEKNAFPVKGAVDEQSLVPLARHGRIALLCEKGDKYPVAVCEMLRDYKEPDMVYIFGYYVRPDKQGKGYGKIFFDYLFDMMRKDGFEKTSLTVDPDNTAAVKLYEKLGYKIIETRKSEYGEGSDRYYMVKYLGV